MPTDRQPQSRPLSLGNAIRWLPTAPDSSVEAGDESARPQVIVCSEVCRDIDDHLRDAGGAAFGLLRGNLYHCPRLDIDYVLVESITPGVMNRRASHPDAARREALTALIAGMKPDAGKPIGWYRGTTTLAPTAGDATLHRDLFPERWMLALFREGPGPQNAGTLLRFGSGVASGIPFVELLPDTAALSGRSFPTNVAWVSHRPEALRLPLTMTRPAVEAPPPDPARPTSRRTGPFVPRDTTTPPAGAPAIASAGVTPMPQHPPPEATKLETSGPEPKPPEAPTPRATAPEQREEMVVRAQGKVSLAPDGRAPRVLRANPFQGIERIFEPADDSAEPQPSYAAGGHESTPSLPPVVRPGNRAGKLFAAVTLIAVAVASTWFVDSRIGSPATDDADAAQVADSSEPDTARTATDSAAAVARFAIARVDESTGRLAGAVAALELAVHTTRIERQRPTACARADSARARAQLELESVDVAQSYLAQPLDPARKGRLDSLRTRAAAADSALLQTCR